ncbi:putative pentatricopeptide repeat-containing protein [Acorus calamus]|uniref:Pentatricopeptide repeat-containing protein n=1 Tax=Acorus calamus TaxID=4465 RepID=A0AAV9DYI4_ACOCL|nr:putative pentatricopeptide repeat-containing protein [Acorus calamus]
MERDDRGLQSCWSAEGGIGLFNRMQSDGVLGNESTLGSVLSACSRLGALDCGEWVHGFIKRCGLRLSVALGTVLIDMYSKCGHVDGVMEVFDSMREKNVFTWNAAIGGLSMNGASIACLELFHSMLEHGVEPNEVTFVSVLRGCAVAGMVDQGVEIFESMRRVHQIEPTLEHYGCMVDLYGRAGQLGRQSFHPFDAHRAACGRVGRIAQCV